MSLEMIGLETTNRCNYACVHCLRADIAPRKDLPDELQNAIGPKSARRDISLEIVAKIIDEAQPFGIPKVSFTGGEPTLHSQFNEIVRMFAEAGYQFSMVTNATNFDKTWQTVEPYREQFLGFVFSMDGATEETMDGIREKKSFRRSLQAISVCKIREIPFSIQMIITKTNQHEVKAMTILGGQLGAKHVFFSPVQPTLQTTHKSMNLSPQDLYDIQQEIGELQKLHRVSITAFPGFPQVESPWTTCNALMMRALYIDYQGNLTFCCQLSDYADSDIRTDIIGNLAEVNLFDAYNDYVAMITSYQKEKFQLYKNDHLSKLEKTLPCWYCFKKFKKIEWMENFPKDPWYQDAISKH